jgi:uncharacterized protein (DUF433 family)
VPSAPPQASRWPLGLTDAQILAAVPGLTPADLETAWECTAANRADIDEAIRETESDTQ